MLMCNHEFVLVFDFSAIKCFVLDEVDTMLQMGFESQVTMCILIHTYHMLVCTCTRLVHVDGHLMLPTCSHCVMQSYNRNIEIIVCVCMCVFVFVYLR